MSKFICQYLYNIVLMISQIFSVLLGGHPDRSISQRTGEAYLAHLGKQNFKEWWFTRQMWAIDYLFWNPLWKFEEKHCINSLEGESVAKELWDWRR